MKMHNQPTKEHIRQWLHERQTERAPPPSIERIRRQLGWNPPELTTKCVAPRARDVSSRLAT
jgi:hypothetical protein